MRIIMPSILMLVVFWTVSTTAHFASLIGLLPQFRTENGPHQRQCHTRITASAHWAGQACGSSRSMYYERYHSRNKLLM